MKQKLRTLDYFGLRQQPETLKAAKRCGFADVQIAAALSQAREVSVPALPVLPSSEATELDYQGGVVQEAHIQSLRRKLKIMPVVKQIDTLAAEFPAETNYLYLTYNGTEHDVESLGSMVCGTYEASPVAHKRVPSKDVFNATPSPNRSGYRSSRPSITTCETPTGNEGPVIVLGCGPYRIGSSVEFDWCSVSCIRALRAMGRSAVVINCNPETVSTDFDESDRLYFEELRHEIVTDIGSFERPQGVIISVGGQTPNNMATSLSDAGLPIFGTSVEAIDTCENRFKFSKLCDSLRIDQPSWSQFTAIEEAFKFCETSGYPVLVRPSYVLSGAAMRVVHADDDLENFLRRAAVVSQDHPVVISKYIVNAKEVEMDAVAQDGELLNYAIAEHVENAGVHSGDATLLLPAQKLFVETHRRVKKMTQKICRALKISGPFNIQFMCRENEVKVIECNLRASRSFPFISKTLNINFIDMATKIMLGMPVRPMEVQMLDMEFVCVKCPVFSFSRLKNSDPRLGVEMQSTGEVACFGRNHYEAFLKALISSGFKLPEKNILLSIGDADYKLEFLPIVEMLQEMGFSLYATKNTHDALVSRGIQNITFVYKPHVKREPNAATIMRTGKIDLVINIPDSMDSAGATDGFMMRRMAIDSGIGLITDIKVATLLGQALHRKWSRERTNKPFWGLESWQEYQIGN